jgi:D-amino peptidase
MTEKATRHLECNLEERNAVNVFVSVDIEGISGVAHGDMMMPDAREYDRGRRLMTQDANAAIEGLVKAGADYILVTDGHGPMRNLLVEEIHPAAHLLSGSGNAKDYCQLEGADDRPFDAAVFVGYHAMADTPKAIHPHTIAGGVVSQLRLNGRPHGETGLNAAILGSLGIPTVLVTGDSATMAETAAMLPPGVERVTVKEARGRNAALFRPLAECRAEIAAAAKRALANRASVPPYRPSAPFVIEVDYVTMAQCERGGRIAGVEQTGPRTIRIAGDSPWEQYRVLWAALRAALCEPAGWLA